MLALITAIKSRTRLVGYKAGILETAIYTLPLMRD